jgi:hypothetical protein
MRDIVAANEVVHSVGLAFSMATLCLLVRPPDTSEDGNF